MRKTHDSLSDYDKADDEYFRIRINDLSRKSKLWGHGSTDSPARPTKMAKTCNQDDVDISLQFQLLQAARKAVEATCDGYVSSLRQSFEFCARMYQDRVPSMQYTEAVNLLSRDISRFDEQRIFMFQDADVHFEHVLVKHKVRIDQEINSNDTERNNSLDASAKVMDAIENMKMTIRVDWWMFLEEMDRLLQNDRMKNGDKRDDGNDNDDGENDNNDDKGDDDPPTDDDKDPVKYYMDQFSDDDDDDNDGDDGNDIGGDKGGHTDALPVYAQHKTERLNIDEWNFRVETAGVDSMYNWFRTHNGTMCPP